MKLLALATVGFSLLTGLANADVRLPRIFSDHMVLQRDQPVPVWGWAEPGEKVTVSIAGKSGTTTANAAGKWMVQLAALPAGGPQELVVAGRNTITLTNVLVGDVWVCAGQSNMEWSLANVDNSAQVVPVATNRFIRFLNLKAGQSPVPVEDVPNGWSVCTPQAVPALSAVGYFFAQRIHGETGVPIGLVNNAWGGTKIELWLNEAGLNSVPELSPQAQALAKAKADYAGLLQKYLDEASRWVEQARAAQAKGEALPVNPPVPPAGPTIGGIYNGRVAPVTTFAVKGVLWYQGESNGDEGEIYFHKKRALVNGWRAAWNQADMPFYFVQLANWQKPSTDPAGGDGWAKVREAQRKTLTLPHTGMAVAIDVGDNLDIHPRNKVDVGTRLALWALRNDYGQTGLVCSGPLFKEMTIVDNKARLTFDFVGKGLMVGKKAGHGPAVEDAGGQLKQFAIAGEDKKWVWADAVIDGDSVVVSSPAVAKPVAVRYAYAMNPVGLNLYNRDGLPAAPFRTDAW
ncbi:MAG: hypothetical protein PCFJNLEI_04184 [Verrucomicrobiae bacterium]|nr:hypothetical protein [Verrucomicrobiae bacterium]